MKSSIMYAVLAHITTIIIPFILMLVPIFNATETIAEVEGLTQYVVKKVTLLDAHDGTMLFIIAFPWIVSGVSLASVKSRYLIPFDDFGIAVFHPVTSELETIGIQAKSFFKAL